jgi:hypothetical protein
VRGVEAVVMSALMEVSGAAVEEVRDRLVAFVDSVVVGLPHVRDFFR